MEVTIPLTCGNCVNTSRMDTIGTVKQTFDEQSEWGETSHQYGTTYLIVTCPVCHAVNIFKDSWHDMEEYANEDYELLYPFQRDFPDGLPTHILTTFKSAERVKGIDVNAYAILLRRMLELVCIDRKANGTTLAKMLLDLSDKGEIPEKLANVAKGLKDLGNVGAHPLAGELSTDEIPILKALSLALLEYIYTAPFLANSAEKQLIEVKSRVKNSPAPPNN